MYLVIDNTSSGQIFFYTLISAADRWSAEAAYENVEGESLLGCLDDFLRKQHINKTDLSGIAMVTGKGSFTAGRISATVGNVLALAWRLPVASAPNAAPASVIAAIQKAIPGIYVSAKYSGEAHIGGKQQS